MEHVVAARVQTEKSNVGQNLEKMQDHKLTHLISLFFEQGQVQGQGLVQGQGYHLPYLSQESEQSVTLMWIRATSVQSCPLIRLYRSVAALRGEPGGTSANTPSAHRLEHVSKHTQTHSFSKMLPCSSHSEGKGASYRSQ